MVNKSKSSHYRACTKVSILLIVMFGIVMLSGLGSAVACGVLDSNGNNVINSSSISNSCTIDTAGTYTMSGETFTLPGTTSDGAVRVNANHTILNCNGSKLVGNGTANYRGIYTNRYNVTIKNCIISNYSIGLRSDGSAFYNIYDNLTLENNKLIDINYRSENGLINNSNFKGSSSTTGYVSNELGKLDITNNIFNDSSNSKVFINFLRGNYSIVTNNLFYGSNGVISTGSNINTNNLLVKDNVVIGGGGSAFKFYNNVTNVSVINNSFTNLVFFGVVTNDYSNNIQVYNNIAINSSLFESLGYSYNLLVYNNTGYSPSIPLVYPLPDNHQMVLLKDNSSSINIYSNRFENGTNDISIWNNASNINIYNNYLYNSTSYRGIAIFGGSNHQVYNNTINLVSMGIELRDGVTGVLIRDNVINNTVTDFDGWNTGIVGHGGHILSGYSSSNITILNNILDNSGCFGIKVGRGYNYNITGNTINLASISIRNQSHTTCVNEPNVAIAFIELHRTYFDTTTGNYPIGLKVAREYNTSLINIKSNTINNFPLLLRLQGSNDVTHDLTSYWYRSFQAPADLINISFIVDRDEIFGNPLYNNASNTNVGWRYNEYVGQGWYRGATASTGSGTDRQNIGFKIFKNYLYFKNENDVVTFYNSSTSYNVTNIKYKVAVFNLTSPSLYNGSITSGSIFNNNNGNITLTANNSIYIGDASWV